MDSIASDDDGSESYGFYHSLHGLFKYIFALFCSVCISGYDMSVRAAIKHTVETIGGCVSMNFMSAKDTHLILPSARGEKYKHAGRFGVVAVTADWLIDSVAHGKLQLEQNYKPHVAAGALPDNHAGGNNRPSGSAPSLIKRAQLPFEAAELTDEHFRDGSGASLPLALGAVQQPNREQTSVGEKRLSIRDKMARINNAREGVAQSPRVASNSNAPTSFDFDAMFNVPNKTTAGFAGQSGMAPPATGSGGAARLSGGGRRSPNKKDGIQQEKLPTALSGLGSETQATDDLADALNTVSTLLDRFKGGTSTLHALGQTSQQDMPPPPPRHAYSGDGEDSAQRGERSRHKRTWVAADSDSSGPPVRRSARLVGGSNSEIDGFELSQQVGYDSMPAAILQSPLDAKSAEKNAAKERLQRAVTRQKRGLRAGEGH